MYTSNNILKSEIRDHNSTRVCRLLRRLTFLYNKYLFYVYIYYMASFPLTPFYLYTVPHTLKRKVICKM